MYSNSSAQSNGHDEDEDIEKDPNIAREERKRDEVGSKKSFIYPLRVTACTVLSKCIVGSECEPLSESQISRNQNSYNSLFFGMPKAPMIRHEQDLIFIEEFC